MLSSNFAAILIVICCCVACCYCCCRRDVVVVNNSGGGVSSDAHLRLRLELTRFSDQRHIIFTYFCILFCDSLVLRSESSSFSRRKPLLLQGPTTSNTTCVVSVPSPPAAQPPYAPMVNSAPLYPPAGDSAPSYTPM